MSYSTESSKWNAYQFNDPFASDKFIVCNKISKICCRPNCDLSLQTSLKSEVSFVPNAEEAVAAGFVKCPHCLISNDDNDLNTISIDVELLIRTVATVNSQIGFVPPLYDDDPQSQSIREAIMRKNKLRRGSVPAIHLNSSTATKNTSSNVTKNETDHVKLVDFACRHIALAAASTASQIHEDQNNLVRQQLRLHEQQQQLLDDKASGNKKRRRRGGVLGFKELASKSKLSPWHFHRVFKSVTGLTPKVYGDKCWEFVKKYIDRHGSFSSQNAITMSTSITNPTSSPPEEKTTGANTTAFAKNEVKKMKSAELEAPSPSETETKRGSPFSTTTMEDLIATPQSSNSIVGKSYTSPMTSQKPSVDFTQYSMLPMSNDLLLDQLTINNTEPLLSNTNGNVLNSFDILYNDQQPQFQDYQIGLKLPSQKPEVLTSNQKRTKSAPNHDLKLNLQEFELPKLDMAETTKDWNLMQSQLNLVIDPLQQQDSTTTFNEPQTSLDISTIEKANSDAGDYVQTPFNFDLNAYGYFGDWMTIDPLETPLSTLEFML